MLHKNNPTSLEWVCILLSGSLFTALSYSVFTAGRINILIYAVSQAAVFIFMFLITLPLKRYFGKFDNPIVLQAKSGSAVLNAVLSVVYSLYFMYAAAVTIIIGAIFIKTYIDNNLPVTLFAVLIAVCGYLSAKRGINGIAGSTVILTMLSGAAVLFVFISLIFRADMLNFSYVYSLDFSDISRSAVYSLSGAVLLPCVLMFGRTAEEKPHKGVNIWITLSFALCTSIAVMTYAVSGEYSNYTKFPFYTSAQLLEAGSFKRLDVLFLMLWVIGIYINISVLFSSLREAAYMTFESVTAKRVFVAGVITVTAVSAVSFKYDELRDILLDHFFVTLLIILTVFILPGLFLVFNRPRRKKRTAAAVLALLTVLSSFALSGCGKTEIQDRLIVKGIGVDKTTDGYDVTVQYTDTSSGEDKQENRCFAVSGASIADAVGKIKNSIGLEPFFGQLSAVTVGYDSAEDMDIAADYFMRRSDVRPSVKLYLSRTTAGDILKFEKDGSVMPIDTLTSISPEFSVKSNDYTLLSYINARIDPCRTPAVTVLKCADTIRLATVAVFGCGGVYMLDDDSFTAYKLLHGKLDESVLSAQGVSCRVEKCRNHISVDYNGGGIAFYTVSDLNIVISENAGHLHDDEVCGIIERYLERLVNDSAETILKNNRDDVFELGRHLVNFNRNSDNAYAVYRELLSDCEVNVNVKCKIVNN